MAALSTTNVSYNGVGNGRRLVTGQFTGSLGDAEATITVAGDTLYGAQLLGNDADYGSEIPIKWSASGGQITVTVASALAVTTGTFHLIVAGGV